MNLHKLILTNNACYKAGRTIKPKGIMVHSTGANNPYMKRYVDPDDGLLGKNQYNNHWNQDSPTADRFASTASLVSWLTEASPPIRRCRGIIEAGMPEAQRTILISALKSARTV